MEVGLQLYSVREPLKQDFKGTIQKVAECGYDSIEFAGYYGGLNVNELKALLEENGLKSIGAHLGMEPLKKNLNNELELHLELGSKYIILPWVQYQSLDDVKNVITLLNSAADTCRPHGIRVGYHNHAQEFKKFDGKYILDIILENTYADVFSELDVCWVAYADIDPVEYIKKQKGRCIAIHCKDLKDYESKENIGVGDGVLDFPAIVNTAKSLGAEDFIIEQEGFNTDMWLELKRGYEHIAKL